jgi:hypothetical protein
MALVERILRDAGYDAAAASDAAAALVIWDADGRFDLPDPSFACLSEDGDLKI